MRYPSVKDIDYMLSANLKEKEDGGNKRMMTENHEQFLSGPQAASGLQLPDHFYDTRTYHVQVLPEKTDNQPFVYIELKRKNTLPLCPFCGRPFDKIRGSGYRMAADIPWNGKGIMLRIITHDYQCTGCGRESITDDNMPLVRPKTAFTVRIEDLAMILGTAFSFKAAARIINGMNTCASGMSGRILGEDKIQACCERYKRDHEELTQEVVKILGMDQRGCRKIRPAREREMELADAVQKHLAADPGIVSEPEQGVRVRKMAEMIRLLL